MILNMIYILPITRSIRALWKCRLSRHEPSITLVDVEIALPPYYNSNVSPMCCCMYKARYVELRRWFEVLNFSYANTAALKLSIFDKWGSQLFRYKHNWIIQLHHYYKTYVGDKIGLQLWNFMMTSLSERIPSIGCAQYNNTRTVNLIELNVCQAW
jgi:hypothetical protein